MQFTYCNRETLIKNVHKQHQSLFCGRDFRNLTTREPSAIMAIMAIIASRHDTSNAAEKTIFPIWNIEE